MSENTTGNLIRQTTDAMSLSPWENDYFVWPTGKATVTLYTGGIVWLAIW